MFTFGISEPLRETTKEKGNTPMKQEGIARIAEVIW